MRITTATVTPIVRALRDEGLKPVLVGSLARRGWSDHDADIRVGFWDDGDTEYEDPSDIPGVKKYRAVMKGLGFRGTGEGAFESRGREEEAGFGAEVESWQKGDLVVDLFPVLVESKRDWNAFDKPVRYHVSGVAKSCPGRSRRAVAGVGGARL